MKRITRRNFSKCPFAVLGLSEWGFAQSGDVPPLFFKIALGEYSFNRMYHAGKYDPLWLATLTTNRFGLSAIDYVSSFWADKATDRGFLRELKARAIDNGVINHIILVDLPGAQLGDLQKSRRNAAISAHSMWLEIAAFLGCRGIRVNLNGFQEPGNKQSVLDASVDGYGHLLEIAGRQNLDVLVQNHIGYSCDPDWLVSVIKQVNSSHSGIMADPGHFQEIFILRDRKGGYVIRTGKSFDTYESMSKIMPYAKAVNAKTHSFDGTGNETTLDYYRLLTIVKSAGYTGYISIEWEPEGNGRKLSDSEGIEATKKLLLRIGSELS